MLCGEDNKSTIFATKEELDLLRNEIKQDLNSIRSDIDEIKSLILESTDGMNHSFNEIGRYCSWN